MKQKDIKSTLKEIDQLWDALTESVPEDHGTTLGLPNKFIAPSWGLFHDDQFYWDSYFIIEGLLVANKVELARGMVENLTYLIDHFGFVPMRNRTFNTGISQPPLLTSMIRRVYEHTNDTQWLKDQMKFAESEYRNYWMNDAPDDHVVDHRVFNGLSRYADHFVVHQTAEHESGWDMSSRFGEHCLDYLPVDLNSLLYRYETDFAWFYELTGDTSKADHYNRDSVERQRLMHELMWSESKQFYVDYNYRSQQQSDFLSLAGSVPLWVGTCATEHIAHAKDRIETFLQPGGLSMCTAEQACSPQRQWDYPNGWAPYHWFAIQGLLKCGEEKLAEDIARKWITTITDTFTDTGKLWEKYDVVNCRQGVDGRYPTQVGFGWTNATYLALVKQFGFDE